MITQNMLTLIIGDLKMLKNEIHKHQTNIIPKNLLEQYNHFKVELNDMELVMCMFDINVDDAKLYVKLYGGLFKIDDIVKCKMLYQYFNCETYKYFINNRTSQIVKNCVDNEYWTLKYNCDKLNITDKFTKRTFGTKIGVNNISKLTNTNTDDNKLECEYIKRFNGGISKDYLHNIDENRNYVDTSVSVIESKYPSYKVNNKKDVYTKDQISELFRNIKDSKELYETFNTFALSKDLCHLVINNREVLEIMNPLFLKYAPVYKYIFGYAWLYMYTEECIIKTRTRESNRYVFDINTANKLPVFPWCIDDLHMNPYFMLLVDSKIIDSSNNFHGLPMISNYNNYGIDNFIGFKRKFNIFSTGNPNISLFDGLETDEKTGKWKYFAITGSSLPVCSLKRHPLLDVVSDQKDNETIQWNNFFNEYYNDSDIDVICSKTNTFDLMDEVNKLIKVITNNLNTIKNKDVSNDIIVKPDKNVLIVVNKQYIERYMIKDYPNINYVIENFDNDEIKDYFYTEYITVKKNINRTLKQKYNEQNNPLYKHYFKLSEQKNVTIMLVEKTESKLKSRLVDTEYAIYLNDILPENEQVNNDENVMLFKVSESIKFKIYSKHMPRKIEIFKIKYDEVFSCVSRFHLPLVREYYDGNNVYMLPSCISSLMLYVNGDYKYFTGKRGPFEILKKYEGRAFGTVLNKTEQKHLIEFNKIIGKKIEFGAKSINSVIFRPLGLSKYYTREYNYVISKEDLYKCYKDKYGFDNNCSVRLLDFKTINENGFINPLNKWILDAGYDLLT